MSTATRVFGLLWATWFVLVAPVRATHVIGGQIEMRSLPDKPGHFKLRLTYYFDETQSFQPFYEIDLPTYRKRDHRPMVVARIYNTVVNHRPPLVFANPACARARSLKVGIVLYEGDLQLNPSDYDDPQGYYLTHQTCCRNDGIDNIRNPGTTGYTFYLEFPPLLKNGRTFGNSSPMFGTINGEYVCRSEPFTMSFAANDPDGDELRYSLATPILSNDRGSQATFPGPYPEVTWLPGFNATRAFGASSPLSIHPKTGDLSLKASELGLFVFAVKVEEFRGGEKIGEVRRDYQLLVVDCPPITPPEPVVEISNQPPGTIEVHVCEGQAVTMNATANAAWAYQWRRDGSNLPGATGPTLTVDQGGVYQLVTSLREQCSQSQRSRTVTLTATPARVPLDMRGRPYLCGSNGKVDLSFSPDAAPLTWYRNGQEVPNEHAATLVVRQAGDYRVVGKIASSGCVVRSDTVRVRALALPVARILPPTSGEFCRGDSLRLVAAEGAHFEWQQENASLASSARVEFWAKETGVYSVVVTDTAGCQATSEPVALRAWDGVTVRMDSIPGVCGTDQPALQLRGYPEGGTFAGPGVAGDVFYPQHTGLGKHRLRYTVSHPLACRTGTAERVVVVSPRPAVSLPSELTTWRGASLEFRPTVSGEPTLFDWQPARLVVTPHQRQAKTLALEEDETFTLSVQNEAGCRAQASVRVRVYQRIWIPDVFTPNGDGINDVWELKGVEEYPYVEIAIYNRWGEIVFFTNTGYHTPFDGAQNGRPLPTGVYPFTIKPSPEQPVLKGIVQLLR